MHCLVLFQLTNNETALDNLAANLYGCGKISIFRRTYTQQDVDNIKASAFDIVECFSHSNDYVDLIVAKGELDIKPAADGEEEQWFDDVFKCSKFPRGRFKPEKREEEEAS
ncbi:uncharacterized protein Triagg1_4342 [Trichoderma aggressivum f. europaeum]|uniref:Uncharacterized protein n=1 Tax=Trichoderma aggressivum f. europaeum TaxID=173218 RepID=A0AAE1IHB6_9HYPO|nr:hypothetical protein Triagg1_4342 [Trichoderma aggressivum f. europaeum]